MLTFAGKVSMSYTLLLIIITVLVSWYAWQKSALYHRLLFSALEVRQYSQYYRFLTSGFVHLDWGHLFFNMLALYFFGTFVERIFSTVFLELGPIIFLAAYLSGIVVSEIPAYLKNIDNRSYRSLGASGGVASIIFISILYNPDGTIYVYFIPLPSILAGILYLWYTAKMTQRMDGINHLAHLSGGIYGILFAIVTNPGVVHIFVRQLQDFSLFP
jgi:membrane associated rhomboid family serine protease